MPAAIMSVITATARGLLARLNDDSAERTPLTVR
jgi:hypothetical protein